MKVNRRNVTNVIGGFLVLAVLAGACKTQAEAASAADFYKGQKINYIIAANAGNVTDLSVRTIAPYLKKYTGVSAVIIENVPQVGGVVAFNKLWIAKPNGLTLATGIPNTVVAQGLGNVPGAKFQADKLNVVFGLEDEKGSVLVVSATGPYKSIADLKKAKGLKFAGLQGKALSAGYFADLLGLDLRITPGMATTDARMALIRGEIDCFIETVTGSIEGINNGSQRLLAIDISTPIAAIPKVPPISQIASLTPRQKVWLQIRDNTNKGKYAFIGPGVPKDRIEYLRNIFARVMQDAQYQKDRHKMDLYPGGAPWTSGPDAQRDYTAFVNLAKSKEYGEMDEYLSKKYFTIK